VSSLLVSCEYFKKEQPKEPVARVNNSYLFKEDIASLIQENTTPEDSVLIVTNYINRWATQQLLIDKAKVNLPTEQLENYNQLVNDYQKDLYTKGYKNAIVSRQLDSLITPLDYEQYYEANKENFVLNDRLLQLRYIFLSEENKSLNEIKKALISFKEEDKAKLDEMAIQFTTYYGNDSTWVKQESVVEQIPPLALKNNIELLKNSNYLQLQDSLGVYLVQINKVLERNQIAPLVFVKPTIKQIILNKRKLDLIKKLEADITKDAIRKNDFEVYQ
jgi:hypothetical protein